MLFACLICGKARTEYVARILAAIQSVKSERLAPAAAQGCGEKARPRRFPNPAVPVREGDRCICVQLRRRRKNDPQPRFSLCQAPIELFVRRNHFFFSEPLQHFYASLSIYFYRLIFRLARERERLSKSIARDYR